MRVENRIKQVKHFISKHKKIVVGIELFFYCMGILFDLFILYLCSNLMVVLSSYISLSDRQGLLTMAHLSFFTSVMMGGVLWLLIFRVYSLIKNKEWRNKIMDVSRSELKKLLASKIEDRFSEYQDKYIADNGIISKFMPRNVVDLLVQEHVDLDVDDFIKNYPTITEDEIYSCVSEFVNESYDYESFILEFEKKVNLDELRLNLQDELVLSLINTEPYGYAPRNYWDTRVRKVESIRELSKFIGNDVESFVGKYASTWQYDSKEFSDE